MKRKLSTDELFHFTKFEHLLGIINYGFQPRYVLEHTFLSWKFPSTPATVEFIPMVSFCDIPLSMVDEHIGKYGTCAIGLAKEWGEQFGVNPVIYVNTNSIVGDAIAALGNSFRGYKSSMIAQGSDVQVFNMISQFMIALREIDYFVKQYERKEDQRFFINETVVEIKKGRFYDEREWRFVPPNIIGREGYEHWIISIETYMNKDALAEVHKKMERFSLDFELEDVKYIVCETQEQKEEIIQVMAKKFMTNATNVLTRVSFRLIAELDSLSTMP